MNMRIGIYGGSFNPIHNGHIQTALAVKSEYSLDRVIFMVAGDPPHKQVAANVSPILRYAMTVASVSGIPGLEVSDIEIKRTGKSYTVDTVELLHSKYPGAQLYWILGTDMLATLDTWHDAHRLMKTAAFIAVGRPGTIDDNATSAKRLRREYGANIRLSTVDGPPISSTAIREAVYNAMPVRAFIPEATWLYIYESGLYQPDNIVLMQEKLRSVLKPSRYAHSTAVMAEAIELANKYGADSERARIAGLLHDCAKGIETGIDFSRSCIKDLSKRPGKVWHGPLGAIVASDEYGVSDRDILNAIAYHTICRTGMSKLEKIIYLADKIEPTRDFDGVTELRNAEQNGLDAGVLACMDRTLEYLISSGEDVDPDVISAREYILNRKDKEEGN